MFIVTLLALLLDLLLGEVRRHHPLVMFGAYAQRLEARYNGSNSVIDDSNSVVYSGDIADGFKAWSIAVLPWVVLALLLESLLANSFFLSLVFAVIVLYFAIGRTSLIEHAHAIAKPLADYEFSGSKDQVLLQQARGQVAMIVSRDCSDLDADDIIKAATESVLENGADAIFAALFWYCVAGVPGVVLYRLSNTLDAMWGYKSSRYLYFGRFSARIDDVLNFIPARLTAFAYTLMAPIVNGSPTIARQCWSEQGGDWKSPNAGPVMSAGAGALSVSLGGTASYKGEVQYRPVLGVMPEKGRPLSAATITEACKLVNASCVLFVVVIFLFS